ncbi:ABC transporter ATP-binding protein [Stagnihabitans tardus]|uniref:ABC transporter ATP-binding protein n=1 Tax=Stagnihabitans tardus TaxID=2699202 RepID=UPI001D1240F7|nr:ABC transporter ATP-binding protein [Stagnihabitans tardus]
MAELRVTGLWKAFGAVEVLKGIDLHLPDGAFVSFLGPSGCGKSTLLRCIAGLEDLTEGAIHMGDRDITQLPSARRDIAMVFQNYALYPHMTVRKNMAFGLALNGMPRAEIDRRVALAAETLRIADLLDRKPRQLSGGQRQRVAIGRAITRQPQLFLLDEPLSNLDASLRVTMRAELAALHDRLGVTMVYVTHDQVEAMTLSDLVVVLDKGRVAQVGRPLELFHRPANLFVAGFIGSPQMNLLPASVIRQSADDITLALHGATLTIPTAGHDPIAAPAVTLGIRPDRLEIAPDGDLSGTIRLAERLGTENHLHIDLEGGGSVTCITDGTHPARARDRVRLRIPPADAHVFDGRGNALPRRLDPATQALITDTNRPADPA